MAELTTVSFGPQHPVLPEPIHLDLELKDEKVVRAVPSIGYVHRGLEKLVEKRDFKQFIYVAERVCGICSFGHGWGYAKAVEGLMEIDVPRRASYLRTIWHEISRLHSHLLWLGLGADALGFESLFMHCWRLRETILDIFEETTGGRVIFSVCEVGGVRRDLTDAMKKSIEERLTGLRKEIDEGWVEVQLHPNGGQWCSDEALLPVEDASRSTSKSTGMDCSCPDGARGSEGREFDEWSVMTASRDRFFQIGDQCHAQSGELGVGADLGHEAAQAQAVAGFAGFLRRHLELGKPLVVQGRQREALGHRGMDGGEDGALGVVEVHRVSFQAARLRVLGSGFRPRAMAARWHLPRWPLPKPRSRSTTVMRSTPISRASSVTGTPYARSSVRALSGVCG